MPDNPMFSAEELRLLADQEFLRSKLNISQKMFGLLGTVEQSLLAEIAGRELPTGILAKSGKISRGEHYRDLPYMILDFPRVFDQDHIFAFRTLFWWGNFFSATLHLSGRYLEQTKDALKAGIETLCATDTYFCINDDPWHYHYSPDNYLPLDKIEKEELVQLIEKRAFIKISRKWPLTAFGGLPQAVTDSLQDFLRSIGMK